ncbi:MAG: hypothetical protein K8J09_19110 [Planctomycetes bacterium]|nr:hypothetical protein [Planctomycetota bacterium]MCC7395579.1 hypothetical protein [Planctomycetota bacterium]
MKTPSLLASLLLAPVVAAQTVLPPFSSHYEAVDLGFMPGVHNYAGITFAPNDPNTLLVSAYQSGVIRAVPLQRDGLGRIAGFGTPSVVASVGGNDGGLAFGPGGVLFFTWYGANRLGQLEPGSTSADRTDDLYPLGVSGSVGAVNFVPSGRPGAGRCKLVSYGGSTWYDVTLAPDGQGTFAVSSLSSPIQLQGGPEGMLWPPPGSPLLGTGVLVAEWNAGLYAYSTDQNGDPMPATRQLVMAGLSGNAGGAIDPVSGDFLFSGNGGRLCALRLGAVCGTMTSYGQASPGAGVVPTLTGSGCARLGQTISLRVDGNPNAFGVLAFGSFPVDVQFAGLRVLTNLELVLTSGLGGTGIAVMPLYIPVVPSLGDAHFYFQAAYLDATTPSGLAATAGLDLWIR